MKIEAYLVRIKRIFLFFTSIQIFIEYMGEKVAYINKYIDICDCFKKKTFNKSLI